MGGYMYIKMKINEMKHFSEIIYFIRQKFLLNNTNELHE